MGHLLRVFAKAGFESLPGAGEEIKRSFIVLLTSVDLSDDHADLGVGRVLVPHDLLVHFQTFVKERQGISVVSSFHVTTKKLGVKRGQNTYLPNRVKM